MEKNRNGFVLAPSFILLLGLISFILCLVAEFNKPKRKDLKWNGQFCYLPESRAFEIGITALICISVAQIMANIVIYRGFWTRDKSGSSNVKLPVVVGILLFFSWISFGVMVVLTSTAASMSREQGYEEGWLDRECYLVKDGVYSGSGGLVLLTVGSVLGVTRVSLKPRPVESQGEKVHVQLNRYENK